MFMVVVSAGHTSLLEHLGCSLIFLKIIDIFSIWVYNTSTLNWCCCAQQVDRKAN